MTAAARCLALQLAPEAGLQWHELRERDAAGRTLVTERGWAPRAGVRLAHAFSDELGMRAGLSGWAARARYDGQSQGGVPIESHTDTQSLTLDAAATWQPRAWPALQLDFGAELEHFRRRIAGANGFGGLDERLAQPRWRLGAAWQSESSLRVAAALRLGERAPMTVRFDNGLFDEAHLRSGRSRGASLEASWALGRDWRAVLGAETLKLDRSADAPLFGGGVLTGTVAQPQWRRDAVWLQLQRPWN